MIGAGAMAVLAMVGETSGYGQVALALSLLEMGMGTAMAPATDSIMGSLPLAEAGVGSAMNDATRQVGGALGVAILGSVLAYNYSSAMAPIVAASPLPSEPAAAPLDSIGGALAVAAQVGAEAAPLVEAANLACIGGMRAVVWAAVGTMIAGAVVTWIFLPARPCDEQTALVGEMEGAPVPLIWSNGVAMDSKRPGRPRDETIDAAIVDALFELVEEQGLAALTIDAIAERAGVSKATIYRRWASKEELMNDSVARLEDAVVFPESGDIREDLLTGLSRVRLSMTKSTAGAVFPWLVGEVAKGSEIGRRFAEAVIIPGRRKMAERISQAIEQGQLRSDLDVELAVDMLTGPALIQKLLGAVRTTDPDWTEKLVDNLLKGWRPNLPERDLAVSRDTRSRV